VTRHSLPASLLRSIAERFDADGAVNALMTATAGDMYLFGGAIRRTVLGDRLSGDLDIMVPNGDDRAFAALAALKVPASLNSQGLRRYRWGSLQIDLFQPREFFGGFVDVESALRFFDLRINALAMHFGSQRILDPFDVLSQGLGLDPGINWPQWTSISPVHTVKLAIRLAKTMHEVPTLTISAHDARLLGKLVAPRLHECNWDDVQDRFPPGKTAFLRKFEDNVLTRVRLATVWESK
jgi:hypothetical protein